MLRLASIRAMVALAEAGTIRGAARRLGLSQSALTKTLRELETETGAALFHRSAHGTEFTPIGQALLAHARQVLTTIARAEADIHHRIGTRPAHVRLSVTPTIAVAHAATLAAHFYARDPGGIMEIDTEPLSLALPRLIAGELDFAVMYAEPARLPPEIAFQSIRSVRFVPGIAQRLAATAPRNWDEAVERRWAVNVAPGSADGAILDWMRASGLKLRHEPLRCRSPFLMATLIEDGYIALIPAVPASGLLPSHGAIGLNLNPIPDPVPIGIATLRDVPSTQAAQSLIERMAGLLRDWLKETT